MINERVPELPLEASSMDSHNSALSSQEVGRKVVQIASSEDLGGIDETRSRVHDLLQNLPEDRDVKVIVVNTPPSGAPEEPREVSRGTQTGRTREQVLDDIKSRQRIPSRRSRPTIVRRNTI